LARTTFGVAENSQHLFGRALDIHLESRLEQAMETARAMKRGGVGWYPRAGFMHIDTGPVRNWTLDAKDLDRVVSSGQPEARDRHPGKSTSNPRSGLLAQRSRRNLIGPRTTSSSDRRQMVRMQRVLDDLLGHRIE
jgi:Bacterial protein of unknown function (DUF882)